jgi:hypothetical protein
MREKKKKKRREINCELLLIGMLLYTKLPCDKRKKERKRKRKKELAGVEGKKQDKPLSY